MKTRPAWKIKDSRKTPNFMHKKVCYSIYQNMPPDHSLHWWIPLAPWNTVSLNYIFVESILIYPLLSTSTICHRTTGRTASTNFGVLLTVHLSIFISVFNQLDAQNLFHNKFYFMPLHVSSTCAHHQEVKIALHKFWYHHTYSFNDTRGCVMQFWPPDDEYMCSKHVEAWNKTYCETNFVHQVG